MDAISANTVDLSAGTATSLVMPPGMNPVAVGRLFAINKTAVGGTTPGVDVRIGATVLMSLALANTAVGLLNSTTTVPATALVLQGGQTLTIVPTGTTPTGLVTVIVFGVSVPNL